jgi:hypothetical protein
MSAHIEIDRNRLLYIDNDAPGGPHKLVLAVEWASVAKTEDHPVDVEIQVGKHKRQWNEPAGEPIPDATWERILDEIAASYSKGPQADIIGEDGALLRGVSKFRFYLNVYPFPSRYYEPGRYLEIPMVQTDRSARPRLVLDVAGIHTWTSPPMPLSPQKLEEILARAVKENPQIGLLR